ncbi:ATP-binding protein [Pseudonocardia xinjiangensis]
MWRSVLDTLPRGYNIGERDWQRRHRLLLAVLAAHVPGLVLFGVLIGHSPLTVLYVLVTPLVCLLLGSRLRQRRRAASVLVTAGLVYSSAALVGLSGGAIEAHFHFFIIIGFIALYQDWAPFLFNIVFTVVSHGIGSGWHQNLIFNHPAGQGNPWLWSAIHGIAVLFACAGMMLFWRITEESQREKDILSRRLANAEIGRRQFTSDLLVNLARRNESMLYRQLDILNQLEESERDPDALAELFKLDHLATRVRRNAESLLVLSGEKPSRTWSEPVPLRDVLRAAVAETEHLDRVVLVVDEQPAVFGQTVTDLTHLIAELTENAVRFSPPDTVVTIRTCPDRGGRGGQLVTVEDWGVGMPRDELASANALLADPPEVDLSVAQRLGFHVVARLAVRHRIRVSLTASPGSGVTAVIALPAGVMESPRLVPMVAPPPRPAEPDPVGHEGTWEGWWDQNAEARTEPALLAVMVPAPRSVATAPGLHAAATIPGPRPAGTVPVTEPRPAGTVPVTEPHAAGTGPDPQPPATDPAPQPPANDPAPQRTAPVPTPPPATGSPASRPAAPVPTPPPPATDPVPQRAAPPPSPPPGATERTPRPAAVPAPRPAPSAAPPRADPPRPVPAPRGAPPPDSGERVLRRRVPQASLAPELREPLGPEPEVAVPPRRAEAVGALSRYQASRLAALAATENAGRS